MKNFGRLANGELPRSTWPGMYPIVYRTEDGETLCAECANRKNGSLATVGDPDPQWNIVDQFVFLEGEPLVCAHCRESIDSAYGYEEPPEDERCDWCQENGIENCRHIGM